ncbi:MAG: hypothetical protein HC908_10930 [Calothrix sp. SM1_7_51]|nr:hypothetical protein [Calothrix sp. SM1_7_51]
MTMIQLHINQVGKSFGGDTGVKQKQLHQNCEYKAKSGGNFGLDNLDNNRSINM